MINIFHSVYEKFVNNFEDFEETSISGKTVKDAEVAVLKSKGYFISWST